MSGEGARDIKIMAVKMGWEGLVENGVGDDIV
jgi:hypothetical protein